jgi:hypothetical protein
MPEVRLRRHVRLVFRKGGERSHAATAFLASVEEKKHAHPRNHDVHKEIEGHEEQKPKRVS